MNNTHLGKQKYQHLAIFFFATLKRGHSTCHVLSIKIIYRILIYPGICIKQHLGMSMQFSTNLCKVHVSAWTNQNKKHQISISYPSINFRCFNLHLLVYHHINTFKRYMVSVYSPYMHVHFIAGHVKILLSSC